MAFRIFASWYRPSASVREPGLIITCDPCVCRETLLVPSAVYASGWLALSAQRIDRYGDRQFRRPGRQPVIVFGPAMRASVLAPSNVRQRRFRSSDGLTVSGVIWQPQGDHYIAGSLPFRRPALFVIRSFPGSFIYLLAPRVRTRLGTTHPPGHSPFQDNDTLPRNGGRPVTEHFTHRLTGCLDGG